MESARLTLCCPAYVLDFRHGTAAPVTVVIHRRIFLTGMHARTYATAVVVVIITQRLVDL